MAPILFLCAICPAQEKSLVASKAYIGSVKSMFQRMEIVDIETPPDQMDVGDLRLPAFKLRNKGGAPISAPRYRDDSYSDFSKPAPLGVPYWKFTPVATQDKTVTSYFYFKGMTFVPSAPLEPGAVLGVSTGGKVFSVTGKLPPGKYRLSVAFHAAYPFGFAYPPGPLPSIAISHPEEFVVTVGSSGLTPVDQKSNRTKATPAPPRKAGSDTYEELLARNDRINRGKSPLMDAITLEKLELSADVVKQGAPFSYTYTLSVKPGSSISGPARLNFTCIIYRLTSSSKREMVYSGMRNMDFGTFTKLCRDGSCVGSHYPPGEVKLEPGSYELELCFWDGIISYVPGATHTKRVRFKIAR